MAKIDGKIIGVEDVYVDSNFLAILKYNEACCFQCLNDLDTCVSCLKQAIKHTQTKLT